MATITLEYNPRTKGSVDFLKRMRESGLFAIRRTSFKRKNGMGNIEKNTAIEKLYGMFKNTSLLSSEDFANNKEFDFSWIR